MDDIPTYEKLAFERTSEGSVDVPRDAFGTQYLNALALAALKSTEGTFHLYEPLFVDLAARWTMADCYSEVEVLSAFSRILPFAPYLRTFAGRYAASRTMLTSPNPPAFAKMDDAMLRKFLLAIFRLLSFDFGTFSRVISPLRLQSLFQHRDRAVRYLSIRCFALCMRAADAATEKIINRQLGDGVVDGEWEDITIDYRYLGLWEEQRWKKSRENHDKMRRIRIETDFFTEVERLKTHFNPQTAEVCGVLLPRFGSIGSTSSLSSVVKTPTAVRNLRRTAQALLISSSILLVGLPNSGKSSLIGDIAASVGQAETMVTLHLNEQTDARSLLGMYASSPITGAFTWQPGVLTRAAKEGCWILIEDLNRAPSEVIGLILPIIEKGELTISSRKETIKCAATFKIIATMKSSYNVAGDEVAPNATMLGSRLWQRVQVDSLPDDEIGEIIIKKFPLLESRRSLIMEVYRRLCSFFHGSLSVKSSQGRTPGLRDLLKVCSRLHMHLKALGMKTGYEASHERTDDEIFLDMVDVFLRYLPDGALANSLALSVAEVLLIPPQRAHFCFRERVPLYSDQGGALIIGRQSLQKSPVPSRSAASPSSRFAPTASALKLMEQTAAAIQQAEPVLLVGETGVGKTTVVQQLASLMRQKLSVVNLSQQSESTDLLGGFKPINIRTMAVPLLDEFTELFELTFSAKKNQKFMSSVTKSASAGKWMRLITLWHEAIRLAHSVFNPSAEDTAGGQPSKRRKLESTRYQHLRQRWDLFSVQLKDFEAQVSQGDAKFSFAFVQGKIIRALRNGEWVLLDEINLASPDTLENISSLLQHGSEGSPSVLLSEAGDVERILGHPDFRIFGAMNPATDAGKRELPPGLRSRFTEFYVHSPDNEFDDLLSLCQKYLDNLTIGDRRAGPDLAQLYMETKRLSIENGLTDGAGQRPHFSIRTLVRTLIYTMSHAHVYGLRRAMYEGFCMSFLTCLSQDSERLMLPILERHIFGNAKNARSLIAQTSRPPSDCQDYVRFRHYWIKRGHLTPEEQPHYIITPFIEKNLMNLVRASSTCRFPVLLQGPTSAGKTSMIEYLAKVSGNEFVRINNHEHTDLQEYLGTYVSADDGTLLYQEGVLVEALRNGYWIVLDELNLAPSDVLEALNRLLDDNRELFIPETQEVVHPHANFMLFATQNPAGLYGGRKVLSRAFRNRFLELHFDDIPVNELEIILMERSQIAPPFCRRIVEVYRRLSLLRQVNRLFEQKHSFVTLRDLFRWALRPADDRDQLAVNGFMLLAERVRNPLEREAVKAVIEEVMKVHIDEDVIYGTSEFEKYAPHLERLSTRISWTKAMRRLFILTAKAIENNEPVLLVGETGCGKTQLCQSLADVFDKQLLTVNAHVNLETGDLIGAQRPVRNRTVIERELISHLRRIFDVEDAKLWSLEALKRAFGELPPEKLQNFDPELVQAIKRNIYRSNALFEWSDGSLVTAMKTGSFFLLDEISLADDSVLERLNSVLEPQRTVVLAEKGPIDSMVVADSGFQFLSTMNPGGDYGKRELSGALRNRMTEIWAPQLSEDEDILPILDMKLNMNRQDVPKLMLEFAKWFRATFQNSSTASLSIRDLLTWVGFVNKCHMHDPAFSIVHGAAMVFIDTLGANPSAMLAANLQDLAKNRQLCLSKLGELFGVDPSHFSLRGMPISVEDGHLCIGPFSLLMGGNAEPNPHFILDTPTTLANSVRVVRGLQLSRPILLEGSPGVGKTTLVTALAGALGKRLTRINLSEQTDLTDLFGSDVPVEGGDIGQFTWRDAPFLLAMQRGDWVLLDEMNLASQSVLEGLNSCLDHRHQVYVAELDQTFDRHPDFALFAAQNPHHQGGGRKGLPASFVNRFTVVYADGFTSDDLMRICTKLFPESPSVQTEKLVNFISLLNKDIQQRQLGAVGGPWEINLRDIQRWLQLADRGDQQIRAKQFLDVIIAHRFRSEEDRASVYRLYENVFRDLQPGRKSHYHNLAPDYLQIGLGIMRRDPVLQLSPAPSMGILPKDLPILESLITCIDQSWPSILVGGTGCGKTTLLKNLAAVSGSNLVELALNPDTDAMDLVGGFEQSDCDREILSLLQDVALFLECQIVTAHCMEEVPEAVTNLLELHETFCDWNVSMDTVLSSISMVCRSFQHPVLDEFFIRTKDLIHASSEVEKMKVGFEWTEGVLTQAVQLGHWVVLDNANLCNPSVLDRLNSLAEPNGSLILNEQRTEDGYARVIKPHPNFRLFLTMDPRHGELSRAMRNRCVEIYILPQAANVCTDLVSPTYTCESALYRLRRACNVPIQDDDSEHDFRNSLEVRLDHLSGNDISRAQDTMKMLIHRGQSPSLLNVIEPTVDRYVSIVQEGTECEPVTSVRNEVVLNSTRIEIHGAFQPLHPLVNEPLLSIWGAGMRWSSLASMDYFYRLRLEIHRLSQAIAMADQSAESLKPSEMTCLERSIASRRIPPLAKDSMQPVGPFLVDTCQALYEFVRSLGQFQCSGKVGLLDCESLPGARDIIRFCWDMLRMASTSRVDEGEFQSFLQIGRKLCSSLAHSQSSAQLGHSFSQSLGRFNFGWALATGLSMELIWKLWRPVTPATREQLFFLMELRHGASKFAELAARSRLNLTILAHLREALTEAQSSVLVGGALDKLLLERIRESIMELEDTTKRLDLTQYPYFSNEFEAICQYHDLCSFWNGNGESDETIQTKLPLLAGRPAWPLDSSNLGSQVPDILHRMSLFSGSDHDLDYPFALNNVVSLSLLGKLTFVGDLELGQMDMLEGEMKALAKAISLSSVQISTDQFTVLRRMLSRLLAELILCHREFLEARCLEYVIRILQLIEGNGSCEDQSPFAVHLADGFPDDHYFGDFARSLPRLISSLATGTGNQKENAQAVGTAAAELGLALLRLFVPDKSFDPSLGLTVQRARHNRRVYELNSMSMASEAFEASFTGEPFNVRYELLQNELRALGAEPPPPSVSRPEPSEIGMIQVIFSSLLTSVLDRLSENTIAAACSGDSEAQQALNLVRDNIWQLISRLGSANSSYEDITILVVRFLQILNLGLFLVSNQHQQSNDDDIIRIVSRMTPLLGGADHPIAACTEQNPSLGSTHAIDVQFLRLSVMRVASNADPSLWNSHVGRAALLHMLGDFHFLWETKLREDQEKEAQKSETYRYRGSWGESEEVDEKELRELFPTYDDDSGKQNVEAGRVDPREFSVRLSSILSGLFESENAETSLLSLVKESARLIGSISGKDRVSPSPTPPQEHLPGVLLLLDCHLNAGNDDIPNTYNFYTDSNLTESRKLVSLTHSVRSRFVQLQAMWPEHAAIADVIGCCREILQFKHAEPTAKLLTKVEKLHSYVHEWQTVASREYSSASLCDKITSLIISWRRLELSTWARLLDIEEEKCKRDVAEWWFVAYEATIGAPIRMVEAGESCIDEHINEVVSTLEQFFLSANLGQYSHRLKLVADVRSLLRLFAHDYAPLNRLVSALNNFLQHYLLFEPAVHKFLSERRLALEKDIKEQVQLASWKDTNIAALRESARRSHYKLFKVVRKYREVLAQQARSVLERGMPGADEDNSAAAGESVLVSNSFPEALAVCQKDSHIWLNRAPRFKNPDSTASNMAHLYSSISTEFDVSEEIDAFVRYVIGSIHEFKSKTPKVMSEDNEDDVQHLKTQKRRFYADTLRRLMEMGIRRNVGTNLLDKQASVAQVLATSPALDVGTSNLIKSADSYFHRVLILISRARIAARNHSEEISNVEVSRSIGSAEYLLFLIRKQRGALSSAYEELGSLKSTLSKMATVWAFKEPEMLSAVPIVAENGRQELLRTVAWLTPILGLVAKVMELHAAFSETKDSSSISRDVRGWKDTFERLGKTLLRLAELPDGITSQLHEHAVGELRFSLQQLRGDVAKWTEERPDLSFVTHQLSPWINNDKTAWPQEALDDGANTLSLQEFDSKLLAAVDKMLVGLQKFSEVSRSVETSGLLSRSDEFFTGVAKTIHLSNISHSLQAVMESMRCLQCHPGSLSYAAALVASVLPITNKYYNICKELTERFTTVHRETCKMSYVLTQSFTQVASEGFCSPAEATTEDSKPGKLESGTGLGEGQGAEDISKDIGDDEDLTELAQQENAEGSSEEMEDSGDAVNMDQEELNAQATDHKEDEKGEENNENDSEGEGDIDEETGSVDGLEASAVDEKLWDGARDEQQKETENEEGKGVSQPDSQTAAKEQEKEKHEEQAEEKKENAEDKPQHQEEEEEDEGEEEEAPDEEGEAVGREELDVTDSHAKKEDALDLPEGMQLDGEEEKGGEEESDDGMDDLSDMGTGLEDEQGDADHHEQEQHGGNSYDGDMEEEQNGEDQEGNDKTGEEQTDENGSQAEGGEDNAAADEVAEEEQQDEFLVQQRDAGNDVAEDNVAPSEGVTGGLGEDQDQNAEKGTSGDAQQDNGTTEQSSGAADKQSGAAKDSEESKRSRDAGGADDMGSREDPELQAFKRLGDILEQWHRQRKELLNASKQEDESHQPPLPPDTNMADADFEHLADQEDAADTQALGQASEEQAKAVDQNKGVESDIKPGEKDELLADDSNDPKDLAENNKLEDSMMQLDEDSAVPTEANGAGAFVPDSSTRERTSDDTIGEQQQVNEELDQVDSHLAAIHLTSSRPPLTPQDEARQLWSHYESLTNNLALSLTEQLRLILSPTLASKLRGDFRTGKRLNIKRIIPYIASQYKRDKIWMRRSIPSKRNYQIMLAVDDSKSMLESGSGQLAFETLALVSKSLSMLEVGDLCVLGFGNEEHVRVAHEFGQPFSSEAGTRVFEHFSYQQTGTNVRKLIADSIALFREARLKRSPAAGNADLWQLELIISDGICEDHEMVRRLVRQALEERIMIVFIIVDAVKGSSILDLSQASFEKDAASGEMRLTMKRYLEGFPFPYYLVVRDVKELPTVLATALKQWFAEVVDVS